MALSVEQRLAEVERQLAELAHQNETLIRIFAAPPGVPDSQPAAPALRLVR